MPPPYSIPGYNWTFGPIGPALDLEINDDDNNMDWTSVDNDGSQTVSINNGTPIAFGGSTIALTYTDPDLVGTQTQTFNILWIPGPPWLLVPQPGYVFGPNSSITGFASGPVVDISSQPFDDVFCFTSGSRIETDNGTVPVENIQDGDRVRTKSNGYQTVRWVGKRQINHFTLKTRPNLRPILFKKGSISENSPNKDMMVSPQHRMYMSGPKTNLLFWENEVLAPAKSLTNDRDILTTPGNESVTYVHIMFDQHQIVNVDGCWSESFYPGTVGLDAVDNNARKELLGIFPDLATNSNSYEPCLPVLTVKEGRVFSR